jgi:hypothetical protein
MKITRTEALCVGIILGVVIARVFLPAIAKANCPYVVPYSKSFFAKLLVEQAPLADDSALMHILEDYMLMRDQARKCAK